MIFTETKLAGVFIIELKRFEDERGFFAPSFSEREFAARGLATRYVESNVSYNISKGTVRGLHYQAAPHGQAKLVRCTMGAVFDVAVDLRPNSPTFRDWVGVDLTAKNHLAMYIPGDLAHGFQTLEDRTEVFYQVSDVYHPESYRGLRWNDPAFNISWPAEVRMILPRDQQYPDFDPAQTATPPADTPKSSL